MQGQRSVKIGEHSFDRFTYDDSYDILSVAMGERGHCDDSEVDDPVGHWLGFRDGELVQVDIMWAREALERDGTVPVHREDGGLVGDAGPAIRQLLNL